MKLLILLFTVLSFNSYAIDLTISIKNINTNRGNIKVALFKGFQGFPSDTSQVYLNETVDIDERKAKVVFYNLEPGDYAVSLFHDVNNNSRLDTRFKIPTEPLGFSNNPRLFGKPNYQSCRMDLLTDTEIDVYLKKLL